MSLIIDRTLCTSCGICVADCVCGILTMKEGVPCFLDGKSNFCVHCGHCVSVCPSHAVTLDGIDPMLLQPTYVPLDQERCLDSLLKGRRSIRQYKGASVDQALLEVAMEYASYAPTAHNARQVTYTVINGRAKVEEFLEHVICHMDKNGMFPGHVANVRSGHDTLFRGSPCLVLIHAPERILSETDCSTAASYLELAFHALGLGSCWAGMLIESCVHGLPEGIDVPEGHKLYGALMVGDPAVSYCRIPFRNKPEIFWK